MRDYAENCIILCPSANYESSLRSGVHIDTKKCASCKVTPRNKRGPSAYFMLSVKFNCGVCPRRHMLDHIAGYRELCNRREESVTTLIQTDITNLQLFEKVLGFQHKVQKTAHPIFQDKHNQLTNDRKYTKKHFAKDITFNLCSYNIEYIFAAMELLKEGHLHVAFNTIRPVYESIPKIFYTYHRPQDAFYIFLQGQYNLQKSHLRYERVKKNLNTEPMSILDDFLTGARKSLLAYDCNMDVRYVDKKFRKFTNRYYREQVYTDEQLVMQNETYAALSSNSHANVTRFDRFAKDSDENRSKFAKILSDVAFFNFFLLANICHEELEQAGEMKDTLSFLTIVNEEIGVLFQITNLYPQKPEYIKNLIIEPIWDASSG